MIWRRPIPDPFIGDVILFVHVVPVHGGGGAASAPTAEEKKLYFSTLNFLMLLVWWVFLYAFTVFPDEYVVLNVGGLQSALRSALSGGKPGLAGGSRHTGVECAGAWKRVYWNLFIAAGLYAGVQWR